VQKIYSAKYSFFIKLIVTLLFSIVLTLFIELSIFPILAFFFGYVPTVGIFSNTMASPLFSFIIMPALFLYLILPFFIGKYFLYVADYALNFVIDIARYFANLDFAQYYTSFIPNYLLFIFLLSYLFAVVFGTYKFLKVKLSYFFATIACFSILFYTFFIKSPDIIIDYKARVAAFKMADNRYVLSNTKDAFLIKNIIKNPYLVHKDNLYKWNSFMCFDEHCITTIKGKIISFANNAKYFLEDCGNVDIIIISSPVSLKCKNSYLIDLNYLNSKGSTTIYLGNDIKIKSANFEQDR
jgi:hypothetical protein